VCSSDLFERVMRKHMREMKEAIEARAARSHVFKRPVTPESSELEAEEPESG
jgi:hypothetical protein